MVLQMRWNEGFPHLLAYTGTLATQRMVFGQYENSFKIVISTVSATHHGETHCNVLLSSIMIILFTLDNFREGFNY